VRDNREDARPTADATKHFWLVLSVYLLGLLLGGLYVGIISPMRTVVQQSMGLDDSVGIWMINIYTLFYAATIPISGKLADRYGRKRIFTSCVGIFSLGAIVCGLSGTFGGFGLLIFGRMVQAVGAGGMIPVATAEAGTSAPPDKRGMALGLAAAVAGLANVLGSVVGSALLGALGSEGWPIIFYLALPISALIIVGSFLWLPDHTAETAGKLDIAGSALLLGFVLMLLFGLKDIDFFDFAQTFLKPATWIPLLVAIAMMVVFGRVERRVSDPVFHMEYLSNRQIAITMVVSLFVGASIISMVLIPEFAEAALDLPTGSGGYYLAIIGVFAIAGPPISGAFIDRVGVKPVLMVGLVLSAAGFLFLALVTAASPSVLTMLVGLAIVGLGMGFSMGTPLNYMILENTAPEDSNSAVATLALVRQIGTTLAPALLVGFISQGYGMAGFQYMLACVAVFNIISMIVIAFYREVRAKSL